MESKIALIEQARILNIKGRHRMTKEELKSAIETCIRKIEKDRIFVKSCRIPFNR